MRNFIVLLLLLIMGTQMNLTAQGVRETGTHALGGMLRFSKLTTVKNKKVSKLIGIPYVYEKWTKGSIDFGEVIVTVDNLKIDVLNNYLEIKIEGVEKVLDKIHFKNFAILDPTTGEALSFVHAEDYKYKGKELTGFMKIRDAGDIKILTLFTARLAAPSRSSISETSGSGKTRVVKKNKLYISKSVKLYQIKRRRDLYKVFTKNQKKVKAFIKDNDMNTKDEQDLMKLALFYQKK
jgi:hypothetical protein